ncbi:MAG: helix-turn-helix domain-containing protein [Pseudonocardiaceae bacterium]
MPVQDADEPLIITAEVAKRLGVTSRAVTSWIQTGVLTPAFTTPGGRYRWRWSEVQQQLREQQQREQQ